jgi:hypothetical protein
VSPRLASLSMMGRFKVVNVRGGPRGRGLGRDGSRSSRGRGRGRRGVGHGRSGLFLIRILHLCWGDAALRPQAL